MNTNNYTKLKNILLDHIISIKNRHFSLFFLLITGLLSISALQAAVVNHNIGSGHLVIQGTSTDDYLVTGTTTQYQIIVGSGYNGTITLKNVRIENSKASTQVLSTHNSFSALCGNGANTVYTNSCIAIMGKNRTSASSPTPNLAPVTKVNLILEGENVILQRSSMYYCAIQVDEGAQVHISAIDPNDNTSGKLTAKSNIFPLDNPANGYVGNPPTGTYSEGGAGIGAISPGVSVNIPSQCNMNQGVSPLSGSCSGNGNTAGGNVIISSGTVTAWGGHGAGIGGGYRTYYNGIIIIYGGVIEARGGFDAAGIGSGCPQGTGVLTCYADNSTVFALPPCDIRAWGAGANASGYVGTVQYPSLGLTGTKNLTYLNDPSKHKMSIRTSDYEPDATIYLDLTQTAGLVPIFNALDLSSKYDLTKVKVGKTASDGWMYLTGQLEQNTTFFTDASSSQPITLGRPYMPVATTVLAPKTIILPLLPIVIAFTDYPSIPLEEGYIPSEALTNAPHMKVEYMDPSPMIGVSFTMLGGLSSDFKNLIFLAADSLTVIPPPTTLTAGDVFFIIIPIKDGKPRGVYSEVLLIDGVWQGTALPGQIRRIGEQRVVYNDTETNTYIKVTAAPDKFSVDHPTNEAVTLKLNINHLGLSVPYDKNDVVAKYIVTTEANYADALAATPLSGWNNLNVCSQEGVDTATIVSFSGKPVGDYYIHWYVVSGIVYAHSKDVTDPPRLYGGFGTYEIKTPFTLFNDTVGVLKNKSVLIDVKANDDLPLLCLTNNPSISINPIHGAASLSGDKILYVPSADYVGKDSLVYSFLCSGTTKTAKVFIIVHSLPDNIVDVDCHVPTPSSEFTVKQQFEIYNEGNQYTIVLVGDLDGDGLPELVGYRGESVFNNISRVAVFNGQNGTVKATINIGANIYGTSGWCPSMTGLIVDADKNGLGELMLVNPVTRRVDKYEADTTGGTFKMTLKWSTSTQFDVIGTENSPQPIVADLNGDGVPELIVFNKIYNAVTGVYLGQTEATNTAFVGRAAARGGNSSANFIAVADFDGDGIQEIAAGGKIYKPVFSNNNATVNCSIWRQRTTAAGGFIAIEDGFTAIADVDLDGDLDVVVVNVVGGTSRIHVWTPKTNTIIDQITIPNSDLYQSYPFVGDIDGETSGVTDKYPEICVVTRRNLTGWQGVVNAYKYNPSTKKYGVKWILTNSDTSGGTGITLFDFNNDGVQELVYRDETQLQILNGKNNSTPTLALLPGAKPGFPNGSAFTCYSGTAFEYPVIADTDGDGSANICVTCAHINSGLRHPEYIRIYESATEPWAPTRTVWNQVNYDIVQINEDLTVPTFPIPKNTEFNGKYPYNGSLIQVPTMVNTDFSIVMLAPDPGVDNVWIEQLNTTTMRVYVKITNHGVRFTNQNLPVALYGVSPPPAIAGGSNFITYKPIGTGIAPNGGTDTIYFDVPYAGTPISFSVRIQDDGIKYPADGSFLDCEYNNNTMSVINPFLGLLMKKDATLNSVSHRGTYPNPVSVLYGEEVKYEITAVNASYSSGSLLILDTLPPYMVYKTGSAVPATNPNPPLPDGGSPSRTVLRWDIPNVGSMASTQVSFIATLQPGVSASQPMFINGAWVTINNESLKVQTNSTFHQGAGISITLFSAGFGGRIYNAEEQALDYMTSPSSGILIVPDEGYSFTGWSHDDYTSLRGKKIEAKAGITHYDTLIIYGNVELHANFEIEKYPIEYFLNGGVNPATNPATYTVESGMITLNTPEKAEDVFLGWTGSNGEEPQPNVVIPTGSMGKLEFYANYLNSGREDDLQKHEREDNIWAVNDELHIRTSKAGSIVRVYTAEGVLQKLHTIVTTGESKIKLSKGIYVVTLNNNAGLKVRIE